MPDGSGGGGEGAGGGSQGMGGGDGGNGGYGGRGANDSNEGESQAAAAQAVAQAVAQAQAAAQAEANRQAIAESNRQAEAQARAEAQAAQDARDAQMRQDAEAKVAANKAAAEAVAAEAARQPISETPAGVVGHEYNGPVLNLNEGMSLVTEYNGPKLDLNVGTGPLPTAPAPAETPAAVSPLAALAEGFKTTPENQQALANQETVRNFLANVETDKQTALAKPGEQYNVNSPNVGTNVTNALDAARASGLTSQTIQMSGGKNNPVKDVTTQGTNIPIASFLGYTGDPGNSAISYGEAKMMQALKAGDLTGVNLNNMPGTGLTVMGGDGNPIPGLTYNEPGQDANSVVAATDFGNVLSKVLDAAKNFIPGYGIAQFVANLISGKMTPGQAIAGVVGDRVASALGVPSSLFQAAFNGDYGSGLAGWATSALNSYIAKETKMDPRLTAMVFNSTGLPSLAKDSLSSLNGGPNFAGATAGAIDSGLSSFGIGNGPATTTGNVPNLGMDAKSQAENILNPNNIAPTTTPLSLGTSAATPTTPLASAASSGTSAGTSSSGLPAGVQNAKASEGKLLQVGDMGTKYTPYDQKLAQLNLAPDPFTKQSDIGNIPTYNVDVAKAATAPFAAQNQYDPYSAVATGAIDPSILYSATGGSVQHFDEGGDANMLAYYRSLAGSSADANIASALKNLSNYDSTTGVTLPKAQMLRMGQMGAASQPKVLPQLAALLQARGMHLADGGQPDHEHPNYDGTPVFRTGGLTGLGGKYVEGKGDGTSDDITAMLADGEYVFSADVVSALGNGSNKAGAQVLDKTVQAIRSRARSAPSDKLPPDAKSPLEYMQSVKGKKHG